MAVQGATFGGEERLKMAFVEVFCDVFGDELLVLLESIQITGTHLGGDFVAYVDQLPEMRVIRFIFDIVPQRRDKLLRGPALDRGFGRQLRRVNINDRGIGRA